MLIGTSYCYQLKAQEIAQRDEGRLGAKAGFITSNVYATDGENFEADPRVGFIGGGFLSIPLGDLIRLQPEVLYSVKGFQATGTFLGNEYQLKRTSTHIDVPIQLMIKPVNGLTILVGPQYSYTLSKNDNISFSNLGLANTQNFENDNIRKNTLGIIGGLDINVSRFVISARAGWDLQKNNGDGTSSSIRYKNAWASLTLGMNIL